MQNSIQSVEDWSEVSSVLISPFFPMCPEGQVELYKYVNVSLKTKLQHEADFSLVTYSYDQQKTS